MRRCSLRALALVVVTALMAASPALVGASGLAVDLDLAPSTEGAGLYEATAQIQDAESGEMLSVPTIVFPKGEDAAKVTSSTPSGGILEFRISISPDDSAVTYAVERREGGDVVASQKATIRLATHGE